MTQDHKNRLGGVFLMIGGAVLAYLSIWRPYQAALAGSATVVLNRTGIGLGIIFPILGAILIAGGEAVNEHMKAHMVRGNRTKRGWVYIAIVAAIALGAYFVVESKFEALGYTV
jgi:hypothetical protein